MSDSCQLPGGEEAPAMALSHLKEKQTHLQIPEVGGGNLANGPGGRSVLSLLRWCGRAGIQPPPSTVAGPCLQRAVFCWMDRDTPGRVVSCGTLCSSGWRLSLEQWVRRPQSVPQSIALRSVPRGRLSRPQFPPDVQF